MEGQTTKKPWYKRWWAITLFIFFIFGLIGSLLEKDNSLNSANKEEKHLEDYSVSQLKDKCVDLCIGGDETPYIKTECKNSCNQIYYYGGKVALINEINNSKNASN
jgi:hypothetical protein